MKKTMNNYLNNIKLDPNYVTGFTDAEGCFHISIVNKPKARLKKSVRVIFQITLHIKDTALLYKIQEFFEVGKVINRKDNACYFRVSSFAELLVIISHFEKYPLLTEKRADFILFKQVLELMNRKESLTNETLQEIVNKKAAMNFGKLSDKLLASFSNTIPENRPIINNPVIYNPLLLSGFVDGEGCFTINIYNRKDTILGKGIKLVFKITQNNKNIKILKQIVELLKCGNLYSQSKVTNSNVTDYMVTSLSDLTYKIIPFFSKYPLQSSKKKEFEIFIQISEMIKQKVHLTKEGLAKIQKIKETLNKR
jgi:LAGLIDADG endonuclease